MSVKPIIALTPGEPAGIGPDLSILLAQQPLDYALVVIADPELIEKRAQLLGLPFTWRPWKNRAAATDGINVIPVKTTSEAIPGCLHSANAQYVINTLEQAVDGCMRGDFDALVTGPVHKGIINDAGLTFTGHTEFLAQRTGTPQPVMMLACPGLRVALATIHVPLAAVSLHITHQRLSAVLCVINSDLQQRFGIAHPRILVCGLNPHAGESGHLGREEIEIISPVIESLVGQGLDIRGPVSADTAFISSELNRVDVVLAMYHDQGLPVIKHKDFAHAVNITLGLPFVRTSVDHGTALTLAASGRADPSSLLAAIDTARMLSRSQVKATN